MKHSGKERNAKIEYPLFLFLNASFRSQKLYLKKIYIRTLNRIIKSINLV